MVVYEVPSDAFTWAGQDGAVLLITSRMFATLATGKFKPKAEPKTEKEGQQRAEEGKARIKVMSKHAVAKSDTDKATALPAEAEIHPIICVVIQLCICYHFKSLILSLTSVACMVSHLT